MTGMRAQTLAKIEATKAMAAEGLTRKEACARLRLSEPRLVQLVRLAGVKFRKANVKTSDGRADTMAALYREGQTLQQIGNQYGISRERVRQLLTRYHGIGAKDGGQHVGAGNRRVERQARKNARYLVDHGCTYGQYRELRGRPRSAFIRQRANAKTRGIDWELSLWQWWTIWQESGHWHERGRGQGYGMCRNGDEGPYAVGNVFIAPCFVNSREQPRFSGRALPIGVHQRKAGFVATRTIRGAQITVGPFPTISQAAAAYWTVEPAPVIGAPG